MPAEKRLLRSVRINDYVDGWMKGGEREGGWRGAGAGLGGRGMWGRGRFKRSRWGDCRKNGVTG